MTGWYGFSKPTIKFIISSDIFSQTISQITLIVPNKKDPEGSNLLNGADGGIVLLVRCKLTQGLRNFNRDFDD